VIFNIDVIVVFKGKLYSVFILFNIFNYAGQKWYVLLALKSVMILILFIVLLSFCFIFNTMFILGKSNLT
ncbi:hypothetical protein DJ499_27990, partial [Klebsiella pneumoniae]